MSRKDIVAVVEQAWPGEVLTLRSHLILIKRLTHERMDSQERLSYEINLPESKETKVLRAAKKISLRVIILCQPFAGGPTAPQPTPTTLPLSGLFLINLRENVCFFLKGTNETDRARGYGALRGERCDDANANARQRQRRRAEASQSWRAIFHIFVKLPLVS